MHAHLTETQATEKVERMLDLAPFIGVDPEALAFLAHRYEERLGLLDAAEPARRAELKRLICQDFDELAAAYKRMARVVDGMPKA